MSSSEIRLFLLEVSIISWRSWQRLRYSCFYIVTENNDKRFSSACETLEILPKGSQTVSVISGYLDVFCTNQTSLLQLFLRHDTATHMKCHQFTPITEKIELKHVVLIDEAASVASSVITQSYCILTSGSLISTFCSGLSKKTLEVRLVAEIKLTPCFVCSDDCVTQEARASLWWHLRNKQPVVT